MFFDNQWKFVVYTQSQNKFIVKNQAHSLPFLKVPADKPRQQSQISLKSWLHNVDLELRFFL